jgi:predicted double-glycine peptidase
MTGSHLAARVVAAGLAVAMPVAAGAQASLVQDGAWYSLPVTSLRDLPFRTVVRQQYDYSCGSAALATLLSQHYAVPVTEAQAFQAMYAAGDQAKIRRLGFSLLDIKHYVNKRGLEADGYRLTLDQLLAVGRPGIAVITVGPYRHFVVVKGARNGRLLIGDPASGLTVYTAADFARVWSGVFFAVRAPSGASAAFNRTDEWEAKAVAPFGQPLGTDSPSDLTRNLPPIYQLTVVRTTPPAGP